MTNPLVVLVVSGTLGMYLALACAAIVRARIKREPLPYRARCYIAVIFGAVICYVLAFVLWPLVRLFLV